MRQRTSSEPLLVDYVRSRERSEAGWGPGGVLVISPTGKHLGTLATGVPTANCGWGDDGSTLYITANNMLLRVKTRIKGAGW